MAFFGVDANGPGIFRWDGATVDPIAHANGAFSTLGQVPGTDGNTVAFAAELAAGGKGIFVGPDPVADKVAKIGDDLFGDGATLHDIGFILQMNAGGDIAFSAFLRYPSNVVRQVVVRASPATLTVGIDIKPGSDVNPINLGSNGVVPVAILSTAHFDATTVNPLTVELAGAPVKLKGKGKGTPMASFTDVNDDGLLDLLLHIVTELLQLQPGDTQATLKGQTFGGTIIQGADTIRTVGN